MTKILQLLFIGCLSLGTIGCNSIDEKDIVDEIPQEEIIKMSDEDFNKEINSIWDETLEIRDILLESNIDSAINSDELLTTLNKNNMKIIELKESYSDVPVLENIFNNSNYLIQALYEHKRKDSKEYDEDLNKFTEENVNIINTLMGSYR